MRRKRNFEYLIMSTNVSIFPQSCKICQNSQVTKKKWRHSEVRALEAGAGAELYKMGAKPDCKNGEKQQPMCQSGAAKDTHVTLSGHLSGGRARWWGWRQEGARGGHSTIIITSHFSTSKVSIPGCRAAGQCNQVSE